MKKVYLFLVVFFSLSSIKLSAKVWRVNNIPGIAADYTTLVDAHNAADPGDTIHLEPSPYQYAALTCTKRLFIVGAGYFLNENLNTQSQTYTSQLLGITLRPGAEGTVVSGIDFYGYDVSVYCHDIIIRRNKFSRESTSQPDDLTGKVSLFQVNNTTTPVTNIIITQNYGLTVSVHYASTGVLINNNFLAVGRRNGDNTLSTALNTHENAIVLVQNNVFRRGRVVTRNSSFANNIMLAGTVEGAGNTYMNNFANAEQFGTANNNRANVNMTTVFVGEGAAISSDAQWKLRSGSPAIGAGYGSTPQRPVDAGLYGGDTPYVLAGQVQMPAVYFFEVQPVGSATDPVDVSVKVKSAGN